MPRILDGGAPFSPLTTGEPTQNPQQPTKTPSNQPATNMASTPIGIPTNTTDDETLLRVTRSGALFGAARTLYHKVHEQVEQKRREESARTSATHDSGRIKKATWRKEKAVGYVVKLDDPGLAAELDPSGMDQSLHREKFAKVVKTYGIPVPLPRYHGRECLVRGCTRLLTTGTAGSATICMHCNMKRVRSFCGTKKGPQADEGSSVRPGATNQPGSECSDETTTSSEEAIDVDDDVEDEMEVTTFMLRAELDEVPGPPTESSPVMERFRQKWA